MKVDKSVDNLSDRLDMIKEEIASEQSSSTDPELEKLSPEERYGGHVCPRYKFGRGI